MDKDKHSRSCFIIAAIYIAVCGFLFFYDETLNPEAVAFADLGSENVPDSENAYFAFLGFRATSGADMHAKGIEMVKASELSRSDWTEIRETYQDLPGKSLEFNTWQLKRDDLHKQTDKGFLLFARQSHAEIKQLTADNQELLTRYRKLSSYPYHREPTTLGAFQPLPQYSPIREMNWLMLVSLAAKVNQGKVNDALQRLNADVRFWRRTMKEGRTLIVRVVAFSMLRRDYLFLSEVIRATDIKGHERQIEGILSQLEPAELDMTLVMRYEFSNAASTVRAIHKRIKQLHNPLKGEWGFTQYPLYKPNATINEIYKQVKESLPLASMSAAEFKEKTAEHEGKKVLLSKRGLSVLYNLIGSLSSGNFQIEFTPYIAKNHEIEGFRRLVALQLEVRKKHIEIEKMGDFVQTAGSAYADPFTGKPMMWDREKGCLFFNKLEQVGGGSVELCLVTQ